MHTAVESAELHFISGASGEDSVSLAVVICTHALGVEVVSLCLFISTS